MPKVSIQTTPVTVVDAVPQVPAKTASSFIVVGYSIDVDAGTHTVVMNPDPPVVGATSVRHTEPLDPGEHAMHLANRQALIAKAIAARGGVIKQVSKGSR